MSGLFLFGAGLVCAWTGFVMAWDTFGERLAIEGGRLLDVLPIFSEPLSRIFAGDGPVPSAFFFVNLFVHIALPLGLGAGLWLHVSRLARPVLLPPRRLMWAMIGALTIASVLLPAPHWLPYSTDIVAAAHLVVALLAFALFSIAAVQAAAMLALQQDLHRGLASTAGTMPPVLTLERWLFALIAIAFALLTATLASGVIFSEALFGKPVQFNHKTLFSGLAWLLFGILLAGRWRWGWRGRQALRWVVTGSVLLLIGYAGSKFVLEVVLGRR